MKYAQKEAAILRRSFRDRPPDFNFTLRLTDDQPTSDRELATCLKRLTQRIRDLRKAEQATFDYYINIEFKEGEPHMHMTVITSLAWSVHTMKMIVKAMWSSSCPERQTTAVYCDRVHNVIGLANYLPKNIKDRSRVETPPEAWNSRTCRLVWCSRGFLTKRKADLWREQCQEWYPQPAVAQPLDPAPTGVPISPAEARQDRPGRFQTAILCPGRARGHYRQREAVHGAGRRAEGWFSPFIWLFSVKKPRGP